MHFYERNSAGEVIPRHFVPTASRPGESRPTRITDARKHGWHPSVTTIQGLLDKPALSDWKITEHLKVAYGIARGEHGVPGGMEYFIERVKNETKEALDKAPKDGTDFHDLMERFYNSTLTFEDNNDPRLPWCVAVDDCIYETCGATPMWISEKSFVHPSGYAGKTDLHTQKYSDGDAWVIDFKTKNSCDKWKPGKMAYPEMAMQLAAYRVGLGLHNARCANVFICLEDGAVEFYEWGPNELDRQFANFNDLLRIWLRNAEYIPGKP